MISYRVDFLGANDELIVKKIEAFRLFEGDNLVSFLDGNDKMLFLVPTKRLISVQKLVD